MVLACDATTDPTLNEIKKDITLSIKKTGMDVIFEYLPVKCKSWPQYPGLDIIVTPYSYGKGNEDKYFGMIISVVDEKRKTAAMHLDERKVASIDELDLIYPDNVTIDTANYKTGRGNFLFGVRVSMSKLRNPTVTFFQDEFMTMYDISQGTIRPVVNKLVMSSFTGEGDGECLFSTTESTTLISVGKQASNGFADMIARVKITLSKLKTDYGNCRKTHTESFTKEYTLKFNGKNYDIPLQLYKSDRLWEEFIESRQHESHEQPTPANDDSLNPKR